MSRIATLITYPEVTGAAARLDDLQNRLAKYNLESVLVGLARVNILIRSWLNIPEFSTDLTLSNTLLPTYRRRIRSLKSGKRDRLVFTRLSSLYLVKQACLACSMDARKPATSLEVEEIMMCYLIANDILFERKGFPSDTLIDQITNLLPFSDYVPQDEYRGEIARTLILFDEIVDLPSVKAHGSFIDIRSEFDSAVGIEYDRFCQLMFSASLRFVQNLEAQMANPADAFILTPSFFSKTSTSLIQVTEILRAIGIPISKFVAEVNQAYDRGANLTVVQKYPLVELSRDRYVCLDPGFLLEKAGRGLYWHLAAALPAARRNALPSFWGVVFENYIAWLFVEAYQAGGKFLAFPKFSKGDEAFDCCVVEGSTLLVFECKSSVLSARAKYGYDPGALEAELNRKVIYGVEGRRKGVAQVNKNLGRFLNGEPIYYVDSQKHRRHSIDPKEIRRVYPVIVVLDNSFLAPGMSKYVRERFDRDSLRKASRCVVTPLFMISASDLEGILPYTKSLKIRDILRAYYDSDRNMPVSLSSSHIPLLHEAPRGRDPLGERFDVFGERLTVDFFGEEAAGKS